jgi:hypothetical protein
VVVRDIVNAQRAQSQTEITQLVFDKLVETDLCPGVDRILCEAALRARLRSVVTGTEGREAMEDFILRARQPGPLVTSFCTKLPHAFVEHSILYQKKESIKIAEQQKLEEMLRAAGGVISLSHIGFDHSLHFAFVSSSFHCGSLCGSGSRYILQKKWGQWRVVKSWVVWVS